MKIPKFNPFPSKNLPPKAKPRNIAEQIAQYPVNQYSENKYLVTKKPENKEAEKVGTAKQPAELANNQVNALVKKYQSTKQDIEGAKLSQFFQVQNLNRQPPLGILEINDYQRLVKEDIIDQAKADSLKKLDQEIATIAKIPKKNFDLLKKLEKLTISRNNLRKPIQRRIEARQGYLGKDIVNLRNKIVEGYQTKINHLDKVLNEVRQYPEVERELKKLGLIERQEFSPELRGKVLQESKQFIQSLDERHTLALNKLTSLIGEDLVGNLLHFAGNFDQNRQRSLDKARSALVKTVEDKSLRSPKQIVPWLIKKETYVDKYWQVFNFLAEKSTEDVLRYIDTEEAKKLLANRREVIKENKMFQQLFGKSYVSSFWKAFQARQENSEPQQKQARKNTQPKVNFNQNKSSKRDKAKS